jgi:fatty acid desaturase
MNENSENNFPSSPVTDIAYYQKILLPKLPKHIFKPYKADLGLFIFFYLVSIVIIYLNLTVQLDLIFQLISGLILGILAGSISHITHNLLHGSIISNKKLQTFFAFWGFLPHWLSPTFYRYWHNYLHHTFTQKHITDPDAYPSQFLFENSPFFKMIYAGLPGSKKFASYFYFFHSFTSHSQLNQCIQRFKLKKQYKKLNQNAVNRELFLQATVLIPLVIMLAKVNFIFLVVLPFSICNYMIMSYIATNHAMTPLTDVNDPLKNTLSLTSNRISDFFCRYMAYHVSHHLYPHVNPRYYPMIDKILLETFPEKYKCLPKWEAIKLLYSTPRIYKDENTVYYPDNKSQEVDLTNLL